MVNRFGIQERQFKFFDTILNKTQLMLHGNISNIMNISLFVGFLTIFRVNYAELVDFVPIIGEILLDDFRMTKFENYEHLHENIKVTIFYYSRMTVNSFRYSSC